MAEEEKELRDNTEKLLELISAEGSEDGEPIAVEGIDWCRDGEGDVSVWLFRHPDGSVETATSREALILNEADRLRTELAKQEEYRQASLRMVRDEIVKICETVLLATPGDDDKPICDWGELEEAIDSATRPIVRTLDWAFEDGESHYKTLGEQLAQSAARLHALEEGEAKLKAERDRLRLFVGSVVKEYCWEIRDLNGGDVQDLAEKHGLIVKVAHAQPCEIEECNCEESDYLYHLAWSEEAKASASEEPR